MGVSQFLLQSNFDNSNTGNASIGDPDNEKGMQMNLMIGITVAVSTSFIQSLGLTIQRKSHVLNESIYPKEARRSACRRPLWHLGFDTYIISNVIGSVFAIGTLPIVILAPLGAVTLIFNAFFAKILLGDTFSRQSMIGTLLVLLGALLIGLFGVVREPNHTLEDLIQLYKRPAFIIYFTIIEIIVIGTLIVNHTAEHVFNNKMKFDDSEDLILGYSPKAFQTILGVSYGCIGGIISSQSLLFAKSGTELLLVSILGDNQFTKPLTWVILIALGTTALIQLYYLNRGLRLCDTVILVPISFCAYNISSIFNGLVYYNQWGRLSWWQIGFVIIGVGTLVVGVLILSWRKNTAPEGLLTDESYENLAELFDNDASSSANGTFSFREADENDDADEKTSLLWIKKKHRPTNTLRDYTNE